MLLVTLDGALHRRGNHVGIINRVIVIKLPRSHLASITFIVFILLFDLIVPFGISGTILLKNTQHLFDLVNTLGTTIKIGALQTRIHNGLLSLNQLRRSLPVHNVRLHNPHIHPTHLHPSLSAPHPHHLALPRIAPILTLPHLVFVPLFAIILFFGCF